MPDTLPSTHVAITMELAAKLLDYLNSKSRSETNAIASAIEQSITINITTNKVPTDETTEAPTDETT